MLEINDLCAGYGGGDVIRNISFIVNKGECLCVLGPNGCGKSTLLKAIARIIGFRGSILLDNLDITSLPRKNLAKKIALLGQSTQVFFPYTVYDTVSMGRYAYSEGFLKNPSAQDRAVVDDVMRRLALDDIGDSMIDELSGGQLQRVFLARTLVQTPDVILLDEPTNHLDLKHQIELMRYLKAWVKEKNKILISVFHDINLARCFGDTALVMDRGAIASYGSIDEALDAEKLQRVYGMDIRAFMLESFEKWQ